MLFGRKANGKLYRVLPIQIFQTIFVSVVYSPLHTVGVIDRDVFREKGRKLKHIGAINSAFGLLTTGALMIPNSVLEHPGAIYLHIDRAGDIPADNHTSF